MKESEIRPQALFNRYLELAALDTQALLADAKAFAEVPCPACASERRSPAFRKNGFQYVLCADCESLFASPRPGPERLLEFYKHGESVKFWGTEFFRQTADARREKMFRPRARLVAEVAAQFETGPGGVFVDVGSGYGIFLEEVRSLGMFQDVVGLEPGPDLAGICRARGFRIIQKAAEEVVDGDCAANFATAFEVLEHVFDPLRFLTGVRRLLKPGASFMFTTLTVSGFDIQVLWDKSKSVYPPHHLNLLSIEGMEHLIRRAGFQLRDLSTPGQLDVDIVRNMAEEDDSLALPRFVSQLLKTCDEDGRRQFQSFLSRHRLSSHVRAIVSA